MKAGTTISTSSRFSAEGLPTASAWTAPEEASRVRINVDVFIVSGFVFRYVSREK